MGEERKEGVTGWSTVAGVKKTCGASTEMLTPTSGYIGRGQNLFTDTSCSQNRSLRKRNTLEGMNKRVALF
jgi:hypothetical protein